jgi:hypothetical protein
MRCTYIGIIGVVWKRAGKEKYKEKIVIFRRNILFSLNFFMLMRWLLPLYSAVGCCWGFF